jgi:hypothetical protein
LGVEVVGCRLDGADLAVRWRLSNQSNEPVEILETWLPHGSFFAERLLANPPLPVAAWASVDIERRVRGPIGNATVENAFLNLHLRRADSARPVWRILVRMRVDTAHDGPAGVRVESITCHLEGFAETVLDRE